MEQNHSRVALAACFTACALVAACLASTAKADVFVSEFMAANSTTLADEDGEFPDWVELHNSGANAVSLLNWGLTDNVSKPFKWRFPATNLPPGGYLVVFASNKDRRVPGAPLHTSFKLDAGGSYLGLTRADGSIATRFSPQYPTQVADVAYGFSADIQHVTLLTTGAVGHVRVPTDGMLGLAWTTNGFNDSAWARATNGIGFETAASELGASLAEDVMADNPVGCWRLNGPTYTTLTNSGSLGAVANGTWNGDVQLGQPGALAGSANTAMRSPGTAGEKGSVPFHAALNPATSFSVEFWMKTELATGSALAPFYSRCGDDGYIIYIQSDGNLQFLQWIGSSWQAASAGANVVSGMTNKWVHVVGVFNSTVGPYGTQYLYTNGVLAGTNALPGAFRNNTCGDFLIGYRDYRGGLDEMAVYGGALSPARVLAHYQAGTNSAGNYAATVQSDAPLAWWRFGEPPIPPSASITANTGSLGAAGDGTLSGGVTSSGAPLLPPTWPGLEANNTCATFNSGQMTVPYNAALNPTTFTVEFWARCTGNPGNYRGVMSCNWTSADYTRRIGWNCLANSGNFWEFNVADGADFSGVLGPAVVLGEWIHLAATHDGAQLVLYADGQPCGTNVTAFQPNTNAASVLRVGAATPWDSTWQMMFPGDLDEVALFSRVLTASEIARRYQVARSGKVAGTYSYAGLIKTDLQAAMLGHNASAYLRLPFVVTNLAGLGDLKLRLKYDDGFVAWLNGVPVASANAPEGLAWNSAATARSDTSDALQFEEFNLSPWRNALVTGTNMLALQGLNFAATNTDFLLLAELEADYAGAYGTNGVYLLPPTPGSLNGSGSAAPGPSVSLAAHTPTAPTTNDDLGVTCRVAPVLAAVSTVTLNWRVMYGATNQTAMADDGAHGDGAAGDGVFGATIPKSSYTAGQMVRWFLTATDTAGRASRWPLFLDPVNSPEYLGTMIADPTVMSAIPVWYWFAANSSAAHTRAGSRVSVFFNGEFYDNAFARERGQSASSGAQKFDFNSGDHCLINDEVGRVEELNLNTQGYADASYTRPPVAFDTYRSAGHPASACFHLLLRVNGGADRVGVFVEQVDERFLDRWGLDRNGALYKFINRITLTPMLSDPTDGVEKKTRLDEDRSDLQAMCDALQQTNNVVARATWMFDNLDLAGFANGLAARVVTGSTDDRRKNMYFYRDTLGTREWTFFPWDQDWTFGGPYSSVGVHPFYSDHAHAGGANNEQWSYHYEALYNDPLTRQMIVRRMRTVMDQLLQPPGTVNGRLESRTDFYYTNSASTKTTGGLNVASEITSLKSKFPGRRTALYVTYAATNLASGINALIPESQPTNVVISLGSIEFNPASGNQDEEFIQLLNTNAIAVDISGWQLGGAVSHTFKPGTVILPTNAMYCSPNVVAFRARSVSPKGGELRFVQGNYNGHLSAWGESLTLTDDAGRLVSSNTFVGAPSDVQRYLRVAEIMYNPSPAPAIHSDPQQFEFIELKNIAPGVTLSLANVRFTNGIAFNFTGSAVTTLAPGQRVLLVRNAAAFAARYGAGLPVAGQFANALDNAGETLRLEDASGEKVLEFAYNNAWYPITDGLGFSLVIVNENAPWDTWGDKGSWRASGTLNGAPGAADPVSAATVPIRVNEALAHTDPPAVDTIELFNPAATNVILGGWFLTDDFFTPKKYRIPGGTTIGAGSFLTFTTNQFSAGTNGFALSSLGEEVWLFAGDAATNLTGYYHGFRFGASPNGASFGRYVNSETNEFFVLQSANTPGTNNAHPRVGPVVISEIMYHPPDLANGADNDLDEFIELQNLTATNVALFDPAAPTNTWRLRDAVDFDFPPDVTLTASARLLVVGFDPATNAAQLAAFRTRLGVSTNVAVLGPWNGKLDNSGESLELQRPDIPNVAGTDVIVPFYLVEAVNYRDAAPWPTNADGLGDSLQRATLAAFGNEPTNWFASAPTAGRANFPNQPPQVTLTAPVSGADFQLPANVLLTANPSDPDGSVRSVEFLDGPTSLALLTTPPWQWTWTNPPAGPHSLTARAVDDAGAATTSSSVAITVHTIPPTVSLTSPAEGAVFIAGHSLTVSAVASDADGAVARVEFFTNGTKFAESLAAPFAATQSNVASGLYLLSAVATDNRRSSATSAVVRVAFGTGTITNTTLVAAGSVWRYWDKGSLPATNWFTAAYSDVAWSNGPAQLGYGNDGEVTLVSYGPNASSKYPTTYFRQQFVVSNAAELASLTSRLVRDDGAVVYLNGQEAFRSNMPEGEIGYDTWAASTVGSSIETVSYTNTLPPGLLVAGTNLLAAEVHQDQPGSSDIRFIFELTAVRAKPAPFIAEGPTNQSVNAGSTASLAATVFGSGPLLFQWRRSGTNLAGRTANPFVLPSVTTNDTGSYSVAVTNANGSAVSAAATLTVVADSDGDGMPDWWEQQFGLQTGVNDANLDRDGDGLTNFQEYLAGTNPASAASVLRIESFAPVAGGGFLLGFTAVSNRTYTVQVRSAVSGGWMSVVSIPAAPTNRSVWTTDAPAGSASRFFRVAMP
jgi:hypothetical protein